MTASRWIPKHWYLLFLDYYRKNILSVLTAYSIFGRHKFSIKNIMIVFVGFTDMTVKSLSVIGICCLDEILPSMCIIASQNKFKYLYFSNHFIILSGKNGFFCNTFINLFTMFYQNTLGKMALLITKTVLICVISYKQVLKF